MSDSWKQFLPALSDHPLIETGFQLLFALILILGILHTLKLFIRLFVGIVQEVKHSVREIVLWLGRLWQELTTWKAEE